MKLTDIVTAEDCREAICIPDEMKKNFADECIDRIQPMLSHIAAGYTDMESESIGTALCILDCAIQRATRGKHLAGLNFTASPMRTGFSAVQVRPRCHPFAGSNAVYYAASQRIALYCAECGAVILSLPIGGKEKHMATPWKHDSLEKLREAGYSYQERGACADPSCKTVVYWFITPKQKWMPFEIVEKFPAGPSDAPVEQRYQPHFATCPGSRQFSRKSKDKIDRRAE